MVYVLNFCEVKPYTITSITYNQMGSQIWARINSDGNFRSVEELKFLIYLGLEVY